MNALRDGAIAVFTATALATSTASAWAPSSTRPATASLDPSPVVAGISQLVSSGAPGPMFAVRADVVPIVSGDEDTPVPSTFVLVAASGAGRVLGMGHDGLITNADIGLLDNRRFARQAIEWLDTTHRRSLGVTSGHGETMRDEWSDSLRATMTAVGWTAGTIPGPIDAAALAPYSVVLVSNAAGLPPTEAERAALLAFVQSGGGLILQGLGWGWAAYHPGMDLSEYPMNQIGAMFGMQWIGGSIDDPTDRYEGSTVFHRFYPDLPAPSSTAEALDMIRATDAAHVTDLGPALQADAALRASYTRAHLFLRGTEQVLAIGDPGRIDLYERLRDALNASGSWFHRTASYDPALWPAMAWLRERAARTLADAAPLTPGRVAEIGSTLGLWGAYAHLWSEHHLLILDNLGMDAANLAYVGTLMDSIPAAIHDLRSISVGDYLGVTDPAVSLDGVGAGGVNVFAARIGASCEEEFPPDAPERGADDVFCVVVAHEVNHAVDAWLTRTQPWFGAFRDTCLVRAGDDPMHYLRTFGVTEFFAGTANQWFTDSWLTVRLGIVRAQHGIPWPIDQAYLFVTAYSNGDPFTRFYHNDCQGHFTMERAPVERDARGRITDLWHGTDHVHFDLDALGHVAGVDLCGTARLTLQPAVLNPHANGGWTTAVIEPVPPASAAGIDVGSIRLNGTVGVEANARSLGDADRNGTQDLSVRVRRSDLAASLAGSSEVTVTGLAGTQCFSGTARIRVTGGGPGSSALADGEAEEDATQSAATMKVESPGLRSVSPMPAHGRFSISFAVPDARPATLALFDVVGRRVLSRDLGSPSAGLHSVTIGEGAALPPGLYLVRLEQAGTKWTRRVLVIP